MRAGSYQDLRSGAQGFSVFGNNTDVKDSRENKDETRSWGGTWKDKKRSRSCLKTTPEETREETKNRFLGRVALNNQCIISCFGTFTTKACELCSSTHVLPITAVCPNRKATALNTIFNLWNMLTCKWGQNMTNSHIFLCPDMSKSRFQALHSNTGKSRIVCVNRDWIS